jgi:uncharacterized membrane protein (DUF4010 family)
MTHNTPLSLHFKDKHIWLDMILLALLFIVAHYFPLLKIVPLIASLELFSFFCFHLLAKGSRFQLQGFLGGFISSTAVFLQVLNEHKFAATPDKDVLLALLFAICAMLLECVFIIYFLTETAPLNYYLPFVAQLVFFCSIIVYINVSKHPRFISEFDGEPVPEIELLNDHPIVWKNVIKLSLFILAIIWLMHFIGSEFGLSRGLSTLLVSLFEAHAILASLMTEWSISPNEIQLLPLFLVILLGNTLSKSYLVYKGTNLRQKGFFITVIILALVLATAATLMGINLLE